MVGGSFVAHRHAGWCVDDASSCRVDVLLACQDRLANLFGLETIDCCSIVADQLAASSLVAVLGLEQIHPCK